MVAETLLKGTKTKVGAWYEWIKAPKSKVETQKCKIKKKPAQLRRAGREYSFIRAEFSHPSSPYTPRPQSLSLGPAKLKDK